MWSDFELPPLEKEWFVLKNASDSDSEDFSTQVYCRVAAFVTGIRLESGAREETGRFRDVKRCVATGDRTRVSGLGLLRHNR